MSEGRATFCCDTAATHHGAIVPGAGSAHTRSMSRRGPHSHTEASVPGGAPKAGPGREDYIAPGTPDSQPRLVARRDVGRSSALGGPRCGFGLVWNSRRQPVHQPVDVLLRDAKLTRQVLLRWPLLGRGSEPIANGLLDSPRLFGRTQSRRSGQVLAPRLLPCRSGPP